MYNNIKFLELELTAKCNASCPQCNREEPNIAKILKTQSDEINLDKIKSWFSQEFLKNLELISFKGTYSEPVISNNLLEITEYFVQNTNAYISIHTNGSLRKIDYWTNLGKLLLNRGQVVFGIDGLDDTHSIYRVNTNYKKILENATAFINSGGKAIWQFIIFKHNEHQIEIAKQVAKDLKFSEFLLISSTRFETVKTIVINNDGAALEKSTNFFAPTWQNTRSNFKNTKYVTCKSEKGGWILVDWSGEVFPCCMSQIWKNNIDKMKIDSQLWYKKVVKEENSMNLNYNSMENIVKKLQYFYNSLNKSFIPGICAKHCGDNILPSFKNKLNFND